MIHLPMPHYLIFLKELMSHFKVQIERVSCLYLALKTFNDTQLVAGKEPAMSMVHTVLPIWPLLPSTLASVLLCPFQLFGNRHCHLFLHPSTYAVPWVDKCLHNEEMPACMMTSINLKKYKTGFSSRFSMNESNLFQIESEISKFS